MNLVAMKMSFSRTAKALMAGALVLAFAASVHAQQPQDEKKRHQAEKPAEHASPKSGRSEKREEKKESRQEKKQQPSRTPETRTPETRGAENHGAEPQQSRAPENHAEPRRTAAPATRGSNFGAMGGRPAPAGARDLHASNGSAVRMRPGGRPSDFHDAGRGMDIHNNLAGGRRVVMERPDHSRVVFERGRPGYIAHPYLFHGVEFGRRTYYWHGRVYDRYYRPWGWHGLFLDVYVPHRYWGLGFYGWAYHPWRVSVRYGWGWRTEPWYGYYGRAYWTPYPVYAGPNYWLGDYVMSQSLSEQYDAEVADSGTQAPPPMDGAAPVTPEVQQAIADEVQRQLSLEQGEAAGNANGQMPDPATSGIAGMLGDGQPHVFVAGKEVDVVDAGGKECAVTEGDVVQTTIPVGPNDKTASMVVLASKGGPDCRKAAIVQIPLDDLQEMQNHMRETVDQGLEELQQKQGQDGLPTAPAAATAPPTETAMAEAAPPPDAGGDAEIKAAAGEVDQSEKEVLAAASGSGQGSSAGDGAGTQAPAPVVSIRMGQTPDEVTQSLGQPTKVVNLGSKSIYLYPDMKVTFVDGKVSGIE